MAPALTWRPHRSNSASSGRARVCCRTRRSEADNGANRRGSSWGRATRAPPGFALACRARRGNIIAATLRGLAMIPIAPLQRTAEALMAKAAIEIPEDYLSGLRRCADTEKGELSAFVLRAMLVNYEARKEARRGMGGDHGVAGR